MNDTPHTLSPLLVEMSNITKRFEGFAANQNVNFSVQAGEIHALLGENGAGKTTLMNILSGLYRADKGEIRLKGKPIQIGSPRDAIKLGIGMVYQHFMLIKPFTVVENICFGLKSSQEPLLDLSRVAKQVRQLSKKYGLAIDPQARVQDISVGAQQRVEIIKALYRGVEVLILDEPTAVLTPQESDELFKVMRNLTAQGHTVIFITHKLDEVIAVADRITVLRNGQNVATVERAMTNKSELARMMVGREVLFKLNKSPVSPGRKTLEVQNLWIHSTKGWPLLRNLSFSLRAGEILGVAGVDGNGQSELAQALMGTMPVSGGRIILDGEQITSYSTHRRLQAGIGYVPEDRNSMGLIGSFSIAENIILDTHFYPAYSCGIWLKHRAVEANTRQLIHEFDIKARGSHERAACLSGGNLQKLVLAREVSRKLCVLIASQPTRGLDIGATEFIRKRLLEQRDQGLAILLISADLDEILGLSDRIVVFYEGEITGEMSSQDIQIEKLGLMMAGTRFPVTVQ